MSHLKSILFLSVIALGVILLGTLTDIILRITLDGLLSDGNSELKLLILRGLEILVLTLLMTTRGWPQLKLRAISLDLGIGTFLVLGGWGTSALVDFLLESSGAPPLFAPFKAHAEATWAFLILAILVGPLLEELFFRAGLYIACSPKNLLEKSWVLVLSSLLFASLHLNWTLEFTTQLPLFVVWTCCGVATMALYTLRRSLLPGYFLHGGANAVLFFL